MKENNFLNFLELCREESFFLVAVPGNSGDVLLQKGLEMYLKEQGFTLTDHSLSADTILIHGGGNIDDVWYAGIQLTKDVLQGYPDKKIIIAPSTCHFSHTDFSAIVNSGTQEMHIFLREENSYLRLQNMRLRTNVHVYVADDTAFLLEGTEYLTQLKRGSSNDYTLFAFRTDRESAILRFESQPHVKSLWQTLVRVYHRWFLRKFLKRELGSEYHHTKKRIVDASFTDFDTFVSYVAHAGDIYTDRLHVGILGAMLGKKVYLYKTRYDKIQGVYEQTLRFYPNVIRMF